MTPKDIVLKLREKEKENRKISNQEGWKKGLYKG